MFRVTWLALRWGPYQVVPGTVLRLTRMQDHMGAQPYSGSGMTQKPRFNHRYKEVDQVSTDTQRLASKAKERRPLVINPQDQTPA